MISLRTQANALAVIADEEENIERLLDVTVHFYHSPTRATGHHSSVERHPRQSSGGSVSGYADAIAYLEIPAEPDLILDLEPRSRRVGQRDIVLERDEGSFTDSA